MTIQDILDRHGVSYMLPGQHHHVTQGWIGVDCPWCSPGEERYRLGINEEVGFASCWTCGPHRLGDVLMRLTGEPWPVVRGWLRGRQRPLAARLTPPKPPGRIIYPPGLQALTRPYRAYLRQRGFDPDEIARLWSVQATGPIGPLAWRLFVPIRLRGEIVSWTTRAIGDGGRRYVNAGADEEKVPAKSLLYGADLARGAVVVCEGPLDAWAVGPGAVATMGVSWTRVQLLVIGANPVRAICFDREPDARHRAERLACELGQFPGETHVIELETGPDPAGAERGELDEIRSRFLEKPYFSGAGVGL